MKKSNFCLIVSTAVLMITPVGFSAWAVPQLINYQGMLRDGDGYPVTDPALPVYFRICDAQIGGVVLWEESHVLDVQNGIYNVVLGSTFEPGTLDPNFFDTDYLWLEVEVDGEPGPMTPRQRLTSVPYALKAEDSETLDGLDSTTLDQSAHVGDMGNPHDVTAAQIGAVSSADLAGHAATPSAHHTKTTSFAELIDQATDAQIPAGITRDGELTAGLATKADTGHNHDGRYYTQAHVDALEARIAALESKLQYLTMVSGTVNGMPGPHMIIEGANLHVRSGSGSTDGAVDGLGNLIVGYNEPRASGSDKSGSHNIVVGANHNYSSYSGLVVGNENTISNVGASVSGGAYNTASGLYASVSGGNQNTASFFYSSVSGGYENTASSNYASVSGGSENTASSNYASVSGGYSNDAWGDYSSVSGGHFNTAYGKSSSVSGGSNNTASGEMASICGGLSNMASGDSASVSGGNFNTASGKFSSVSSGAHNEASGISSFVGGGGGSAEDGNLAWSNYSAVLGGKSNVAGDALDPTYATGMHATVSGGLDNRAQGEFSSISGGEKNETRAAYASVSGGEENIASGSYSSVSGGQYNLASGDFSSVSGGNLNDAEGNFSSVSGGYDNTAGNSYASVTGGRENTASGAYASVTGGQLNDASGIDACVSGGYSRTDADDYHDWQGGHLFSEQ